MRNLIIPSDIQSAIDQGATLALSVSGGKDGQAMSRAVIEFIRSTGRKNEMFFIHADLGRSEWPESLSQCKKLAQEYNLPLHVVSRSGGGLMGRLYERMEKVSGRGIPFWPSKKNRYCMSDEKRGPINKHLRHHKLIISVEGIRGEEGTDRAKKQVCGIRAEITSRAYKGLVQEYINGMPLPKEYVEGKRLAYTWYAIHDWLINDVWESYGHNVDDLSRRQKMYNAGMETEALDGWEFHCAYVFGNERVSCRYCIPFGSPNDLRVAAKHDHDGLGDELIAMEDKSGFTFRDGISLREIIRPKNKN